MFGDRRDAGVALQALGGAVAGAVFAEGGEQACGEVRAGAGQRLEERRVFVAGHDVGDEALVASDPRAQEVELFDEEEGELALWFDDALVAGDGDGDGRCGDALFDDRLAAAGVGVIEGAQLGGGRGLEGGQVGEPLQEAAGERGVESLAAELEGLRVVGFEGGGEAVGGLGDGVDEQAPVLEVGAQLAHLGGRGAPGLERGVALADEAGDEGGVGHVVFGARGVEGVAVVAGEHRVDGEEVDEVELAEEGDDVGAGVFDADRDAGAGPFRAQRGGPFEQRLRAGGDLPLARPAAGGVDGFGVEVRVGSVDADEEVVAAGPGGGRRVGCAGVGVHGRVLCGVVWRCWVFGHAGLDRCDAFIAEWRSL